MAHHNERSSVTGRFTPRQAIEEVEWLEGESPVRQEKPARATGRVDTDAAYLPVNHRDPLSKYTNGVEGLTLDDLIPHRRAIMIDAMTGERLDDRIIHVEQPEQVQVASPENHRLLSRKTFGHLDRQD
jgi:hypothetical protein